MKPLNQKNYGSIPHLSNSKLGTGDYFIHEGQEKILTEKKRDKHDNILVFEKYDGSNVGICRVDNNIYALTRSGYLANTSPYKQHHIFSDWVEKNKLSFIDILSSGERIVGEWMLQAHGLKYTITANEPIVFFDLFRVNNKRILQKELNDLLYNKPFLTPRKLHEGEPVKVEKLISILNQKTRQIESDELPEGLIYRVERKDQVDFLAKWVRKDFSTGQYIQGEDSDSIMNKIIQ